MKKIIFALLFAVILLLASCDGGTQTPETSATPQTSAVPQISSTSASETTEPPVVTTTETAAPVTSEIPLQTEPPEKKYEVDPEKPMVVLTFDDGPNGETTERIVKILEENGARATFFVVGSRVAGEVQQKAMQAALDAGCEIGCHTYGHPRMWDLTAESMQKEIDDCISAINALVDTEVKYFRPTGGNLPDIVYECDYPLILWSVDPEDWKNRDVEAICQNIKDYAFDGCIILLHDLYTETADACEIIVPWLAEQGYQMVTVSELFEARGITPENGDVWGRVRNLK